MKQLLISVLIIMILFISVQPLLSKDENYEDEREGTEMMLFGELGYKYEHDISVAIGFKYGFAGTPFSAGISVGLAGFNKNIPGYITYRILKESEIAVKETYPTLVLTFDGIFYCNLKSLTTIDNIFKDITVSANIGFYSQTDTILARPHDLSDPNLYRYKAETVSGLCGGIGAQYVAAESFSIGLGFHSKRGFLVHFGYFWF